MLCGLEKCKTAKILCIKYRECGLRVVGVGLVFFDISIHAPISAHSHFLDIQNIIFM